MVESESSPTRSWPDYAFSIVGGVVKAVYRIDGWEQPPAGERVGRLEHRWAFRGAVDPERQRRYVGGDVSDYFKRGNASPVMYVNC